MSSIIIIAAEAEFDAAKDNTDEYGEAIREALAQSSAFGFSFFPSEVSLHFNAYF